MGWASGTQLVISLWSSLREYVPENERVSVLADIIDQFVGFDWDCPEEIDGIWPEARPALITFDPDMEDHFNELY